MPTFFRNSRIVTCCEAFGATGSRLPAVAGSLLASSLGWAHGIAIPAMVGIGFQVVHSPGTTLPHTHIGPGYRLRHFAGCVTIPAMLGIALPVDAVFTTLVTPRRRHQTLAGRASLVSTQAFPQEPQLFSSLSVSTQVHAGFPTRGNDTDRSHRLVDCTRVGTIAQNRGFGGDVDAHALAEDILEWTILYASSPEQTVPSGHRTWQVPQLRSSLLRSTQVPWQENQPGRKRQPPTVCLGRCGLRAGCQVGIRN